MGKKTSKTADEGQAQGPSGPEIEAGELAAAPFETDAPLPADSAPPRSGDAKAWATWRAGMAGRLDARDHLRDRAASEAPAPDLLVPPVIGGRVLHEIPESASWRPEWGDAPGRCKSECKGAGKCGPCTLRREIRACIEQGLAEPATPWQSPCGTVANTAEVTLARAAVYGDMGLVAVVVDAETGERWGVDRVKAADVLPRSLRAELHEMQMEGRGSQMPDLAKGHAAGLVSSATGE